MVDLNKRVKSIESLLLKVKTFQKNAQGLNIFARQANIFHYYYLFIFYLFIFFNYCYFIIIIIIFFFFLIFD